MNLFKKELLDLVYSRVPRPFHEGMVMDTINVIATCANAFYLPSEFTPEQKQLLREGYEICMMESPKK